MTSQPAAERPQQPGPADTTHRLPAAAILLAALLLALPLVALALVPTYAKDAPRLWGFPFFYWYQFLWVFAASACTYLAHLVIVRARRRGGAR